MSDFFTEHLVKRKKGITDILAKAALYAAGALLFLFLYSFGYAIGLGYIFTLLGILAVWGAHILAGSFNVEFEYTVTNSDIDIDKIINEKKRKRLISLNAKQISTLEPVRVDSNTCKKVIDASKNSKNAQNTYMLITEDNIKILLNPSDKMLDIIKRFNPQAVK